MPDGKVLVVAAVIAAGVLGGKAAYEHAIRPAARATGKAAKATGCTVKTIFTLGHKHCAEKNKK